MTKIMNFSDSANDSLQNSASANEKGIQIFNNQEFGNVRVIIKTDEPMFCLSDICKAVGLKNPSSVKSRLDPQDLQLIDLHALKHGEGEIIGNSMANFVNESGFYDVLLFSDSPNVRPFRKWVTSEVLPSIRKQGGYMLAKENETPEELMARALMIAQETLKRKEQRLLEAENKIKEDAPKVEYFNGLIERGNNLNFRDTAKLLGIGEKAFIFMLIDNKYIYRDAKGKLKPIAKYVDKYFVLKEWNREENGKAGTQTLITVKGREYFKKIVDDILRERQ